MVRLRRTGMMSVMVGVVALAVLPGTAPPLPLVAAQPRGGPPDSPVVPGEVLVKFQPGAHGQVIADTHRQVGAQVKDVIPGIEVHVVRVPVGREHASAAMYTHNPNVRFSEVNRAYQALDHAPNDPRVAQQWQYHNTGQTGGKTDADIDAFEAWHLATCDVPIAILDSGIDQDHSDLRVVANTNVTDSQTVDDRYGHGTHVAGSAAAKTDNATGVAGTCRGGPLYNVKVLNDQGSGAWDWIAKGIGWATAPDDGSPPAKVLNMSLGGYSESLTLRLAVDDAWSKGAILTGAAGNDGQNWASYPGAYANVIGVGATNHNDLKWSSSNWGGNWVDVAAPGENILSTATNHASHHFPAGGSYGTLSGTSMATPHVAGLAALIWSSGRCGSGDNDCVRRRIQDTADPAGDVGPNWGNHWAHGRINAYMALGGTETAELATATPTLQATMTLTPPQTPPTQTVEPTTVTTVTTVPTSTSTAVVKPTNTPTQAPAATKTPRPRRQR